MLVVADMNWTFPGHKGSVLVFSNPKQSHANLAPSPCAGLAMPCRNCARGAPAQMVAHTPCATLHSASSSLHRAFWGTCLEGSRLYRVTSVGGRPPDATTGRGRPPWAHVSCYPRAVARLIRHRALCERGVYNTKKTPGATLVLHTFESL